jgi:aldose 1-epimerase
MAAASPPAGSRCTAASTTSGPGRAIGTQLDLAFTYLDRDVHRRAWVRLQAPDGRGAALWLDDGYRYLELFTGDSLPQAQRRRRGLGIEPMTAPPIAFQAGIDVQRLEPGQTSSASWGICSLP